MQITEEIVNSSSIKMIDEIIGEIKFESSTEVILCAMYGAFCRIRGIIDMADCMKEVLNHERTAGTQEAL